MESELKALLDALVQGQLKIAEGQLRLDGRMDQVEKRQEKTETAVLHMADQVTWLGQKMIELAGTVTGLTREMTRLGERVDTLAEAVTRGFTDAASRDKDLSDRTAALEEERHP